MRLYDERTAPLTLVEDSEGVIRTQSGIVLPDGVTYRYTTDDTHDPVKWRAHVKVEKRWADGPDPTKWPLYEIVEAEQNLLMTVGATQLWNGLSTAGLATPWSTTNTQLVVGDGSTGPAAGNTDMAATLATKINAADATAATNATPIVVTATFSRLRWWERSTQSPASLARALLQSTRPLSCRLPLRRPARCSTRLAPARSPWRAAYSRRSTSTVSRLTARARRWSPPTPLSTWRCSPRPTATTLGMSGVVPWVLLQTNKQAAPPTTLFNRATPGGGLGSKTSAAAWTLTVTLSLS